LLAHLPVINRLVRFARKPSSDKWQAIRATFSGEPRAVEQRHLHRLLTGAHAPPQVLQSDEKIYVAYRPDSDVNFNEHPEITELSKKWVDQNFINNSGDLPRFYSLIFNIKQILNDVEGNIGELGVYLGNSAALLAHYARLYERQLFLFDTFEGFDQRDLVDVDQSKKRQFTDASLDGVRALVGDTNVRFIKGRFPESIPPDAHAERFCIAHIDCDLYEPAKAGLEFFYPRLSPGGLLIVHDYGNSYWPGIRRAVDEYCAMIPERPIVFGDKSGTAMLRKTVVRSGLKSC
jgi:hypothetical protein